MADIYEELRQKRAKLDAQSMLAGIPDFDMNEQQAAPQPAAKAPSNTSSKVGSESTGLLSDIGKGVVKGVAQGGMHLLNAVDDAGNWLNDNVVNLRTSAQQKKYEELKAKDTKVGTDVLKGTVDAWNTGTTANQVSADISEFLLGFIPALRAEKALTGGMAAGAGIKSATSAGGKLAVTAADGAAAGAIASATTVNPEAANLSSLIETHAPSLSNPITRYLQVQGDEGAGEKRLKQALDSVLSGIVAAPVIEGLGAAIRGFKGKKLADGVDPAAEFQAAREATPQTAAQATEEAAPNEMDAAAMGIKEKRNTNVASAKLSKEIDETLAAVEGQTGVKNIDIPADSELARLVPEGATVTKEELAGFKEAMASQAGFVDPTMLAKLYFGGSIREFGSGILGGVAGYNSQDEDAPLKDKLMMAALGYLGGRAVYRMRSTKEIEQLRRENPTVAVLATREGMEGVAPKAFHPRKTITVNKERLNIFAERIKAGDFTKMTAEDTAELQAHIRNIDTAEDIEQLLTLTMQSFEKDFNKASVGSIGDAATGTRTWTQADDASRKINQGIKTVNDLFGDTKYLDARFKAAQVVIASSSQEVLSAAKILREVQAQQYVSGEEASAALDAASLALDKAIKTHTTLVAKVEGAKSEIARGLRVMASKTSTETELAGQLGALVQSIGGREGQLKMAEALRGLTDPRQVNAALNKGFLSRATEAALYVRLTGILWSPITQSKNILGNAMRTITTPMESLLEAGIAGVRGTENGKTLGEVKSEAFGLLQGLQDAISYLWNEKKFGEGWYKQIAGDNGFLVHDGATKAGDAKMFDDNALGNLIQNPTSKSGQYLQMGLDRLGSAMGANLHFMGATDKFFQALNFRMSLNAQAYRAAMAEGLEAGSEEFLTHVAKTLDMPPMEITEKAMNAARESTFQQSLEQGGWLDKAGSMTNTARSQIPMLNILVPFVKTPTNILKYVGSRTPLLSATPLSRQYSAVLATLKEGGPEADKILAQWSFGSLMLASAATLAYQGVLVGGQNGFRDKTQQLQNGQNYALKIGNQTIKIDGLDPIGMFFGIAADIVGAIKRDDHEGAAEIAAVGLMAGLKYMGEKSYMQGLFDFGAMVNDVIKSDQGKAAKVLNTYIAQTGSSFMPFGGLSQWAAKQIDPTMKSYWDWKDRWLVKIPFASEAVPSKRNVLTGEVIVNEGALGPDMLSPLTSKTLDESPAVKEIVRLGINIDYPDKNLDGRIGLTPQQYDKLQVLATQKVKIQGMTLKEHLDKIVSSPRWEQYPDGQEGYARLNNTKQSIIKGLIHTYRDRAEKLLIQEDPDIKALKLQDMDNSRAARKGLPIQPIAKN